MFHINNILKILILVYTGFVKLVSCVLLTFVFFSCADQGGNSGIQDIVNRWNDIDRIFSAALAANPEMTDSDLHETITQASDAFFLSLEKFQMSDLYRAYRAIPFSSRTERSFTIYAVNNDINEVGIVSELALTFRSSVIAGDMEKAKAASADISRRIINLLIIDGEAQRYIASSYFHLLIALMFFIVIIALLIRFLHQSLTISLKMETERAVFSHAYMLAQDDERARISRELHDTIIQDMRFLLLETEKIGNTDEKKEREKLSGKTTSMMADLIRKTREICSNIIPSDFRFSELPDAIQQLCLNFGEKTGIDCRAEIDGNVKLEFLAMEKRLQIFRIIQEALANIEKHAQAKEAIVTMRLQNNIVYIGVSDDGKGFNASNDKSHIGIISMKERAVILGGRLRIESESGEGALVCLEIPVTLGENVFAKEASNGSAVN